MFDIHILFFSDHENININPKKKKLNISFGLAKQTLIDW